MTAHTFTALWPITDRRPMRYLIAEAREDLPRVLLLAHARLLAEPRWSIRRGQDVPGSGGAAEVLVAVAPAMRAQRPADHSQAERLALLAEQRGAVA